MSSRANDDEAHLVLNRRRSARTASAVVYSTVDGYGQYDSHPVQETFTEELKPTDLVETERDFRSRQQRNTRARARAISRADHRAHLLHAKAHSPSTTRAAARQSAATIMHADNTPPRLNNQAQAPLRDAMEGDVGFMALNHSRYLLSTPVMQSLAMHVDGTPSTGLLSIYNQQAPGSQDTERTRSQQKAPPGTHDTERTWTQQAPYIREVTIIMLFKLSRSDQIRPCGAFPLCMHTVYIPHKVSVCAYNRA